MLIKIINNRDFASGMLFLGMGLAGTGLASQYSLGNAMRMGAGYCPLVLGGILAVLGMVLLARGLGLGRNMDEHLLASLQWRPVLFIVAGALAFGILAQEQGLLLAIMGLTLLSGLARREVHLPELLGLSAGLALFGVAVFSFGLGLPLPVLPATLAGAF